MEHVISSMDPERIKKKRSAIQGMMTTIRKNLSKLLVKTAGKFNHEKIQRLRVQGEIACLNKHKENFDIVHEALLQCREQGKDATEEEALVEKEEQHYDEVLEKIYETLQLYADYEESYKNYKATQPDPDQLQKEASEKAEKEALAKLLKDEETQQKREAEAAAKVEAEKLGKELRARVEMTEDAFKEALGMYKTAKKFADDMTKFAKNLSREDFIQQVIQHVHVRTLPTFETKNRLLDRFKTASEAAKEYFDAIKAESGIEEARSKVSFDRVAEDESVQEFVTLLDLMLNAKVEFNGRGSMSSEQPVPRSTPIKVKLNTPRFSGKSRDFALYKKEFMDVIVPGRSNPEIGALLREGLNTKEKNLLRNNEMAIYVE